MFPPEIHSGAQRARIRYYSVHCLQRLDRKLNNEQQLRISKKQQMAQFTGVRVTAPSRLSFTLIDMNGSGGRRNGMASLAIKQPALEATVSQSKGLSISLDDDAMVHQEAITNFIVETCRRYTIQDVSVDVKKGLPANLRVRFKDNDTVSLR